MNVPLAWRLLSHDKRRTALAIVGIFLAIALVFLELGLFFAVPRGGLLFYNHLRFDLMLTSNQYQYQVASGVFPMSRLARVAQMPQVAEVMPIYFAGAKWQDGEGGTWPDLFVIGCATAASPFAVPNINRRLALLRQPDTILVDSMSRPIFGPLRAGRVVRINGRAETIGGTYRLGTGFMGLGVALMSEDNFARLFPQRGLGLVNLGAIVLKPGVAADRAARALQKVLPDDVQVFTRRELDAHEVAYWTTRSAVGVIFGSGLVIAIVVAIMIGYQTLATQIGRHLPQFATMKAIGYADRSLSATVAAMAAMIMALGFVPAFLAALWLYAVIRRVTLLPAAMSGTRVAAVLIASLVIAAISAALAMSGLRRAAPADVFDGRPT